MKKKALQAIAVSLILAFGFTNSSWGKATPSNESEALIEQLVDYENVQDWERYTNLWCSPERLIFETMFKDPEEFNNNEGITCATAAELVEMKQLSPEEYEYQIYSDTSLYEDVEVYFVGINYSVSKVSTYFYNGVNYRMIVTGLEHGERKIIEEPEPTCDFLLDMMNAHNGSTYDYEKALDVRIARMYGIIIDSDGTIIDVLAEDKDTVLRNYRNSMR